MPTYLEQLKEYLESVHPQSDGLWAYSERNQLPANWLLATPGGVWGQAYSQFKMAVKGGYPDFDLQTCTVSDGPTQSCQSVEASVKAANAQPAKLLVGHSDNLVDAVYRVIASAEKIVDITLLSPPTTRFLAAMRNAITVLGQKPTATRPIVRVLYSNMPDVGAKAGDLLRDLVRDLDDRTPMKVYTAVMSSSIGSFNHAKIITVDGARSIVGGHNLWGAHYLDVKPVFDVSMELAGAAALHAHDYADVMWQFVLRTLDTKWPWYTFTRNSFNSVAGWVANSAGRFVVDSSARPAADIYTKLRGDLTPPATGNTPVLSVGRKGNLDIAHFLPDGQSYLDPHVEPGDAALIQLVHLAQTSVRMSQHAMSSVAPHPLAKSVLNTLFPSSTWSFDLFLEMAKALQRGVDISIVLSNPMATASGSPVFEGAFYDGDSPRSVNQYMFWVMTKHRGVTPDAARQVLNAHFHVASFRYSADETYPGDTQIPNHAKTLIVDDRVFYIGSQNVYKSNLNEFGYVIEDDAAARRYLDGYWTPLWTQSQRTQDTTFSDELAREMLGEALHFLLELRCNRRLARTWDGTLQQSKDLTSPDEQEQTAIVLNGIIAHAGFRTGSNQALEVLQSPFFAEQRADHTANADARRFVKALSSDRQLLDDFAAVLKSQQGSEADSDAAINAFLQSKNYQCNAIQVSAALDELRAITLAYWMGAFDGWVQPNGGTSWDVYTPGRKDELRRAVLQASRASAGAATSTTDDGVATYNGPTLTVLSNTRVKLGDDEIKGLSFASGVLSWDMASGNATSGSLTFGRITEPGLDDAYTGLECYGTITWPDTGTAPNRGKVSYYGRWSKAANIDDPDAPTPPFWWPIVLVVGLAGLLGLAAAGYAISRRRMAQAQDDADGRYKKTDGDEFETEPIIIEESTARELVSTAYRRGSINKPQFDATIAEINTREAGNRTEWIEMVDRSRRVLEQGEWLTSAHTESDVSRVHDAMTSSLDGLLTVQENQLSDVLELRPPDSGLEQLAESIGGLRDQVQDVTPKTSSTDIGKLFQRISKTTTSVNDYVVEAARSQASGNAEWLDTARRLDAQRVDLAERANEARSKLDALDTSYDPPDGIDIPETEIDLPDELVE